MTPPLFPLCHHKLKIFGWTDKDNPKRSLLKCASTEGKSGVHGCVVKLSATQPKGRGFEPYIGHDHDSSYNSSTGWCQEAALSMTYLSCENSFHNQPEIITFKNK